MLEKNKELFEFFKFMIEYRHEHTIIRKKLPDALCGMEGMHTHDLQAENMTLPPETRTFSVSFIGYDAEKGCDDFVYVSINTYWEDVMITLPHLNAAGAWYLSVNTYGDENGRYFYREGEETMIEKEFIMRPRSVAVFTGRVFR